METKKSKQQSRRQCLWMRRATTSVKVAGECEAWSLAIGFSHVMSLVIWKRVLVCERRTPGTGLRKPEWCVKEVAKYKNSPLSFPCGRRMETDVCQGVHYWCTLLLSALIFLCICDHGTGQFWILFFIYVIPYHEVFYMTNLYICASRFYNILLWCTSCDHFSPFETFRLT